MALLEVALREDLSEIVTPDHEFIDIDGNYVEAQNLKPNQSLTPLYRGFVRRKDNPSDECKIAYRYIKHPCAEGFDSIEQTHRLVARHFIGDIDNMSVHHIDRNKANDNPENLQILTKSEHSSCHVNNMIAYNRSDKGRARISANNVKRDSTKPFRDYNNSPLHKEHNAIRKDGMKKLWASSQRAKMIEQMKLVFHDSFKDDVMNIVRDNPVISCDGVCEVINSGDVLKRIIKANSSRKNCKSIKFHRHLLLKGIRKSGFGGFREIKRIALHNHKVVSVEFLDFKEDTGCITVKKWHNFALASGVFVKNSASDDIYIPVRNGTEKSRIDTIPGQDVDLVNTLEYFLSKLYSSGKVPKSFLGDEEGKRVSLASQDIRFARTILRVQNTILGGYRRTGDIHLATLGVDTDKVDYSLHLVTPSAIFDEIRYEIMSTQLGIAEEYKTYASKRWIMKNFLGFTDSDIDNFIAERKKEQEAGWMDESFNQSHHWRKGINGGIRDHEKMLEDNFELLMKRNPTLKERQRVLKECVNLLKLNTNDFKGMVMS